MKLIILFAVFAACLATSYNGHRVLRVTPGTEEGLKKFQLLLESPEVNIWQEHRGAKGMSFDVMVSPNFYETFIRELELHIPASAYILINNVQESIDKQLQENENSKRVAKDVRPFHHIDNTFYRNLTEIYSILQDMAAEYSNIMTLSSIGTTYEGRDILLMRVSSDGADTKPAVWIDCGIHAREWITPASCLFYLDTLTEYGTDPSITALLDTYDFYILSVVNPDGYSYTWSDDRLWRKNRAPTPGSCLGTDLNRNFETGFDGPGSSNVACSETYHGPSAFSELESQAIQGAINGLSANGRLYQYYNMHSYSNLWMYSNGYTADLTPDDAEQNRVAAIGVNALTGVFGTVYDLGPISTTIYLASGGSVDWVYDPVGVIYSYTLEFRDNGLYGFALPPDQIIPTATETWTGVLAAVNAGNVKTN